MSRATLIALAALAAAFASVALAQAAVRSGKTVDPLDAQDTTPSLDPRPVTPDLTRVAVAYEEAGAGAVAVSVEFASAESFTARLELRLACTDEPVFTARISRERNPATRRADGRTRAWAARRHRRQGVQRDARRLRARAR